MIPQRVVKRYLASPKDDWRWLKKLSEKEIDRMLANLRPQPQFVTKPWLHQKVCFLLGVAYPQFCFWLDMAGGKTVLSLELLNYWRLAGKLKGALATSLDEERLYSWERDIEDMGFQFDHVILNTGSTKENWSLIEENKPELILCPYPSLTAMLSKREWDEKRKKERFKPNPKLADRLAKFVNTMALDESTKAGHASSVTHRVLKLMRNRTDIRYGLAGVPFGRDPVMLRNQMNLIDGGATFGPSMEVFREAFFTKKNNFFGGKYDFIYKFKKKLKPELRDMLQHRSITYATAEFGATPEVVRKVKYVAFPEGAQNYYEKFLKKFRAKKATKEDKGNAFIKMRQIASGFIGMKDDETGDRIQVEFPDNPKLDGLLDLIDRMPKGRKFLIIYEFTYSGRKIHEALLARGIRHGWLWSGTKNPTKLQRLYDNDPDFMGLVANWRKSAFGLNAQNGNYTFVFESPVGSIERKQVDRRMDRPGQLRTVYLTDLVMRGTADERILAFHAEGADIFKGLMRDEPKNTRKKAV